MPKIITFIEERKLSKMGDGAAYYFCNILLNFLEISKKNKYNTALVLSAEEDKYGKYAKIRVKK